jgi:hypothetical protein
MDEAYDGHSRSCNSAWPSALWEGALQRSDNYDHQVLQSEYRVCEALEGLATMMRSESRLGAQEGVVEVLVTCFLLAVALSLLAVAALAEALARDLLLELGGGMLLFTGLQLHLARQTKEVSSGYARPHNRLLATLLVLAVFLLLLAVLTDHSYWRPLCIMLGVGSLLFVALDVVIVGFLAGAERLAHVLITYLFLTSARWTVRSKQASRPEPKERPVNEPPPEPTPEPFIPVPIPPPVPPPSNVRDWLSQYGLWP